MSSLPSGHREVAWTTDKSSVADENSIMCMIQDCLSDVRGRKVKDFQKQASVKFPSAGTTPRARKAAEIQSQQFSNRPVANDLLIKGSSRKDLKQSCFLPSEKPAAAFLTTLDPAIRKTISISMDIKTQTNSEIETIPEDESSCETESDSLEEPNKCVQRNNSVRSYGKIITVECVNRSSSVRDSGSINRNESFSSQSAVPCRNPSVRSTGGLQPRNSTLRRSRLDEERTRYPQPMTDYRRRLLQKSMSLNVRPTRTVGLERRYSENGFDRRKPCSSDGSKTSSASSSRSDDNSSKSGDSLPVFDLRDLETDNEQIESIIIPGMCNSGDEKRSRSSETSIVNIAKHDTDDIEYFIRAGRTNTVYYNDGDSDTDSERLFTGQCPASCKCELCQVTKCNKPIGIVQYIHGDVIKTYDLPQNAKETEL